MASDSRFDDVVGRYVYLTIDDIEYRVYFEETGAGGSAFCCSTPPVRTAASGATSWKTPAYRTNSASSPTTSPTTASRCRLQPSRGGPRNIG